LIESLRLRLVRERQRLVRVYNSIWFLPVLILIGAIGLFILTSGLDDSGLFVAVTPLAGLARFVVFAGSPSAARTTLASIATGWATILGVVFSVTLVTVQLTASNYTPQILSQFEKDKLNQTVLGSFVGSVTYALLVLKTVRAAGGEQLVFTPILGTNVAVLWAIVDLVLLVVYIGNLISFVRPHRFVENTVRSTIDALNAFRAPRRREWLDPLPAEATDGPARLRQPPETAAGRHMGEEETLPSRSIEARRDGVVSRLNWDDLLDALHREMRRCARAGGAVDRSPWRLRVEKDVGDWVAEGDQLAVLEARLADPELDRLADWIEEAYDIEDERRPEEDPAYGLVLLSAMGVRAAGSAAMQVAAEALNGLFSVLTRIVRLPELAARFLGEADGILLVVERPRADLFEATVSALSCIVDAGIDRQLGAIPEEMGTRAMTLLMRAGRPSAPLTARRLMAGLLPLYQRSLLELASFRSLVTLVDQLVALIRDLVREDRVAEARTIAAALLELHVGVQDRPEAAELVRAAIEEVSEAVLKPSSSAC
jgi:uncharacterized membrane protein